MWKAHASTARIERLDVMALATSTRSGERSMTKKKIASGSKSKKRISEDLSESRNQGGVGDGLALSKVDNGQPST